MNITNTIILAWKVEDDTYPYQGSYEYTKEEYAALDWTAVSESQAAEYSAWLEQMKAIEGQQ
jgi:hypothetical protein